MALTHDQAGHLLHPTQWRSAANDRLVLTSDWDENTSQFSMPTLEEWQYYGRQDRYTFLAIASVYSELDPGVGGLFKMPGTSSAPMTWWGFEFDTTNASLSFVDMANNGNLGGVPGAPPHLSGSQLIEFELLENVSSFVLRVAGTDWCLTAGSTPSSSASAGAISLTQYEGALNQKWFCDGSPDLIGFYDIRSYASNGTLVITTPSDVMTDHVQLSLEAPRPESASQVYRIIEPSLDQSRAPHELIMHQARSYKEHFYIGLAQTDVWTVYPIGQVSSSGTTRQTLRAPETSIESWTADGTTYPSLHLRYSGYGQYYFDTAGPARVPFSGGLWGAEGYPESPQQSWIPVPRHMYDASLPTPSGLSVVVKSQDFDEEFETTSRGAISIRDDVVYGTSCTLKMSLSGEHEQFQVARSTRFMSADGTWGNWTTVSSIPGLHESISVEPGWGIAWVPNAFSQGADLDGRIGLPVGGVALDTLYPREQVTYKVRCLEYSSSGVPTVGPASSITIDITAKNSLQLDGSPMVMRDGLEIPYRISYFTGPTSVHMDSVFLGSVEAIRDFDASVAAESGKILVPWTAFRELDATWPTTSGRTIALSGYTTDLFGESEFDLSGTLATDPYARHESGYARPHDLFTIVSASAGDELRTLCVVDSEDEQHVIDMPVGIVTPPAQDPAGILDGEGQTTASVVTIAQRGPLDPEYYSIAGFAIPRPIRGITTLAFRRENETVIIPIEGNVSSSFSISRDVATARKLGSRAFSMGTLPGAAPELELSGTLYRAQLASWNTQGVAGSIRVASTIQEACRIPADTTCVLRTAFGTCHRVRVVGVSVPRSSRDQAELSFSLVEVDD